MSRYLVHMLTGNFIISRERKEGKNSHIVSRNVLLNCSRGKVERKVKSDFRQENAFNGEEKRWKGELSDRAEGLLRPERRREEQVKSFIESTKERQTSK